MKSISKTFLVKQLGSAVGMSRYLHLGQNFPTFAKESGGNRGDSKVSAAVRASSLPKGDQKTELVPEELRDPAVAIAAAASSTGPKRSELDQRKVRKTECAHHLQGLMVHRNTSSEVTVQCVPFVKMSQASDNPLRRCFETPEELLKQEQDPLKLAKSLIKLKRELQAERAKSEIITQNYLELKAELYARHCATISHNHASSAPPAPATSFKGDSAPVAATTTASSKASPVIATSSSQGKPGSMTASSATSSSQGKAAPVIATSSSQGKPGSVTASSATSSSQGKAAPVAASSAASSSKGKPVTASSSCSPAQGKPGAKTK